MRAEMPLQQQQSSLRIMVVGDSMTQGQQGDYTWRYRIWQWLHAHDVSVTFVGPFVGTVSPPPAIQNPPSSPSLADTASPASDTPNTEGGYAVDVASDFDSHHFALWGMAAAVGTGLIQETVSTHPADLVLLMLGFNDLAWLSSDGPELLDTVHTLIVDVRAANPNIQFAIANVPQRSLIGGRQDLIDKTDVYNGLLADAIPSWSTEQSPVHLVRLQENYDCAPGSCPVGYDGLHPNELGEYQIARAFSLTLHNDFHIGNRPLQIPACIPPRPLPTPANFRVFSSHQGVSATWDTVYGAYSYDVESTIDGVPLNFSPDHAVSNRWNSFLALEGWVYNVRVRSAAGPTRFGEWTKMMSAIATPQLDPETPSAVLDPAADGF